ncbi:MAG: hypothetical protein PT936_00735, partial [Treponema sp.]|nr:hypothetical protein [Treponema sp.]
VKGKTAVRTFPFSSIVFRRYVSAAAFRAQIEPVVFHAEYFSIMAFFLELCETKYWGGKKF